jgi:putative tricarboxylic transport membrane protein
MELLDNLALGFSVAFSFQNLTYALLGCVLGTLIGVLPGIGPVATIAMLLPITFHLPPTASLIMLAGIYYGAQYGGSTTSILVNLPGEASSVVTCLDGYQMARKGARRCGAVDLRRRLVLRRYRRHDHHRDLRGAADAHGAEVRPGRLLLADGPRPRRRGRPGQRLGDQGDRDDLPRAAVRPGRHRREYRRPALHLRLPELSDGIDFAPIAMGLFGIAEIVRQPRRTPGTGGAIKVTSLWPTRKSQAGHPAPFCAGTLLGSLLGVLPGGGPTLGAFSAYTLEKKLSKNPGEFGKGAVEGVAAPEAANNAAAQTSFIPMLTLGIPSNAVMALMVGAMIIQGIQPGPEVMTKKPDLFWGMIASMWIGNAMLVIINLPMIGMWVKLLTVPYRFLAPAILLFCCIGAYSLQNSTFHVMQVADLRRAGLHLRQARMRGRTVPAGARSGPQMEEYFRRAMLLSRGDAMVFIERPISLGLLMHHGRAARC